MVLFIYMVFLTFFLICFHFLADGASALMLPPPPPFAAQARAFLHGAVARLPSAQVPSVRVPSSPAVASIAPSNHGRASMGAGDVTLTISPHFIKSVWKDNKLRNRCGLLVLLPSGVHHPGMLKSKVMPDGQTYHLDILIPDAVINPEIFLLFIRAFPGALFESGGESNAALRESAFQAKMSTMRVAQDAPVWRRFQLVLDFPVVEDIAFTKYMTLDGCYFLYVEFLAQEKSSYMHRDGMIEGDGVMDLNSCLINKKPAARLRR
jgi:hypothetical protein